MRYRKLDVNGDYTLGTGADFFENQPEAVAQAVATRLRLWSGEWFLDTTEGTPYGDGVMGKYHQQTRDAVFKERILNTPGVSSISDYNSAYDGDTRAFSVTATIDTLYGQTPISEVL